MINKKKNYKKKIKLKVRIKMSEVNKTPTYKEINWVIMGIWIVALIIMWLVYWVNAPNLVLFITAIAITIAGPALNYGLLWYKINKTKKS